MTLLLTVTTRQRETLVAEKARLREGRELYWLRWYIDQLDDYDLQREAPTTRLVARELPLLLARCGWTIPHDPRWIAGQMSLRTENVAHALDRLVTLGRVQAIEGEITESGFIQPQLFTPSTPPRPARERGPDDEPMTSRGRADDEPMTIESLADPAAVTNVSAQIDASLATSTHREHATDTARQEHKQRREEHSLSNGSVTSYAAAADAVESNEIVNRLIALAARGQPQSIAAIHYEASGLPDYLLARALESLRGRHPRPANAGGYVVATLRALRAESGIPDTRPKIDREPAL